MRIDQIDIGKKIYPKNKPPKTKSNWSKKGNDLPGSIESRRFKNAPMRSPNTAPIAIKNPARPSLGFEIDSATPTIVPAAIPATNPLTVL
jgi:hypothetical protein